METKTLFGVQIFDLGEIIEEEEEEEITVRGKPFTAKLIRRKGLAKYIEQNGTERLADEATFYDCGPDGVSRGYTRHKDVEPTEAEREEGRRRIREVVTQALISQGIW